jgi:hypothetical protein
MSEISPELAVVADPSHPRWQPPEGNRVTVGQPDTVSVEMGGGDVA